MQMALRVCGVSERPEEDTEEDTTAAQPSEVPDCGHSLHF